MQPRSVAMKLTSTLCCLDAVSTAILRMPYMCDWGPDVTMKSTFPADAAHSAPRIRKPVSRCERLAGMRWP